MTKRYSNFTDSEKEFYFFLGLLSTKFAVMEYRLLQFLGGLIIDDFVLTNTIFEKNSLYQNIELIKEINKKRKFQKSAVDKLIEQISNIRGKRNLFIHGIWGEPISKENDLIINCDEPKLDYSEERLIGGLMSQSWRSVKSYEFRLSYIKKLVENLNDIIYTQEFLIEKLKEHVFD